LNAHPEHSKISFTAKLVAYYRMFSDIPFARDVAERNERTNYQETCSHRIPPLKPANESVLRSTPTWMAEACKNCVKYFGTVAYG